MPLSCLPGTFLSSMLLSCDIKKSKVDHNTCLYSGKFIFLQIQVSRIDLEWSMAVDFCF